MFVHVFLSAKTRQGALDGLKAAIEATRILYEFISERRMTITDSIERCLKKLVPEMSSVVSCSFLL